MPAVSEASGNMKGLLTDALNMVSGGQQITFRPYLRLVIPTDGTTYWINPRVLTARSTGQVYNTTVFNTQTLNEWIVNYEDPGAFPVNGSLHEFVDQRQTEDETISYTSVLFTTNQRVDAFRDMGSRVLFVGEYKGQRFAFNRQGGYYDAAGLYHYYGNVLYPALASQLIENAGQLPSVNSLVVSNSLPIWLSDISPVIGIPLYPSFLVLDNAPSAYGVVHVEPSATESVMAVPMSLEDGSYEQLCRDRVRLTLYGLDNNAAVRAHAAVIEHMRNNREMGLLSVPAIQDGKRVQTEFGILARQKFINYDVSYFQSSAATSARKLIQSAVIDLILPDE